MKRGNLLSTRSRAGRWVIHWQPRQCNAMQRSSMCALCSQRIAADRPESISPMWCQASKVVEQPVRQSSRQAGVPDGYGNHRTCFQAPETTKRAQTNLLHSQQSVRPPFIYCVRQEESLPRIGVAQLRHMHRYRKDERSLIVSRRRETSAFRRSFHRLLYFRVSISVIHEHKARTLQRETDSS